jgi:hypothetical protein
MSTIPGNGATQSVFLQMSGDFMQYSVGATPGSWTTISSWPVTINNSTPTPGSSSILNVKATQPLKISSSTGGTSGYFIAGTTYITFDGSGNTITIDTITNYPGFIRNGTSSVNGNGKSNIAVQNFTTTISGGSTLATNAGWLCQSYFSKAVAGNTITNCTNNGAVSTNVSGGIVGSYACDSNGTISITNCTNNGSISGVTSGGIVGSNFTGVGSTITGCTNTGTINADSAGGIAANACGTGAGNSVTITSCTNSGNISSANAGGITGSTSGSGSGRCNITGCTNTGTISGSNSGGIMGANACDTNGTCNITKCISTGSISGSGSGGITGYRFAFNTTTNNIISNCYSIGNISGTNAGGITGSNVGANNNFSVAIVDISNCYSLGTIATSCGGICGGQTSSYNNKATINITNSYSYGTLVNDGSGLVAISLTSAFINLTTTNTYVAAGSWTDASANAALAGTPTSLTLGNPGSTWASVATNTPYVLSAYNAAVYSPSSATTGERFYTTSPGLFIDPSYNYQSVYTTNSLNSATTQVFVYKGTSPKYYSYNLNSFTITSVSGGTGQISLSSINASSGALTYTLPEAPCFLEGTNILCFENNEEVYRPVESLRKGDLVKTIYNGYMPVCMMGSTALYNPGNDYRTINRIYKCPKEKYPTLFEDLYITGCHSILVPWMTDDQWENTKAVNGNIYVTDNHFRLIACADEKAEPFNKEGFMNIYHIALDHHDICMNYGIYANGLLVESCSIEYLIKYSNLKILGEQDSSVSEDVGNVLIRKLVDTY